MSALKLISLSILRSAMLAGVFFTFAATAVNAESVTSYKMGSGDLIRIEVFGEDDLKREVRLGDGGTISYPFLGDIQVIGKTVGELERFITEGLKGDYLVHPQVSISIVEYRPFYVNGEVEKPGGYPFQPGLTLRKAVSLAGGFTERASERGITVMHEDDPDQTAKSAALDDKVRPGDIITVNQSFF